MPLEIPAGVEARVVGAAITVKGPKGELGLTLTQGFTARMEGQSLILTRELDTRQARSAHGLQRGLLANMVEGVRNGFSRGLEIQGVGFKAELKGRTLSLSLGFSIPKNLALPAGVDVKVESGTKLLVSGIDKQQVGEVASRIRAYFPAEPYKGKGVRYVGERVRRKVGKTVA